MNPNDPKTFKDFFDNAKSKNLLSTAKEVYSLKISNPILLIYDILKNRNLDYLSDIAEA
jgi:membrane protease subunit (stomatin/prohibitin family)